MDTYESIRERDYESQVFGGERLCTIKQCVFGWTLLYEWYHVTRTKERLQ